MIRFFCFPESLFRIFIKKDFIFVPSEIKKFLIFEKNEFIISPIKSQRESFNFRFDFFLQIFAQNLRKYRKRAGFTQKQLSERLEISQKHLSFIETGSQFASASLIDKICDELKISCGELFASEKDVNIREVNMLCTMIQNIISPQF